jgi:2-polyprenyl-3-methyl-5-hydroxy-6-metoxy-1,4-benzoquinol methylase
MYKYPDHNDNYVEKMLITEEWHDGGLEDKYFAECMEIIPEQFKGSLLDVGCGRGRLAPKVVPYFKKIIAIDPDIERLEEAKNVFLNLQKQHPSCKQIDFVNSTIQEFNSSEKFDCILCAHLLHHLTTNSITNTLLKIRSILKFGGFLILQTTNSKETRDQFSIANSITGEYLQVNEQAFNSCIEKNDHYLPTHYFTEETIRKLLENTGYKINMLKKYHAYPKLRGDNFVLAVSL